MRKRESQNDDWAYWSSEDKQKYCLDKQALGPLVIAVLLLSALMFAIFLAFSAFLSR